MRVSILISFYFFGWVYGRLGNSRLLISSVSSLWPFFQEESFFPLLEAAKDEAIDLPCGWGSQNG